MAGSHCNQSATTRISSVALTNLDDNNIRLFLNNPITSPKVKDGLQSAMKLRWTVATTQREIQELQRQLNVITQDQVRLRANLKEMPSTAKAYKRYLEKFDTQETQIEKYQADIKKLQTTQHDQQNGECGTAHLRDRSSVALAPCKPRNSGRRQTAAMAA